MLYPTNLRDSKIVVLDGIGIAEEYTNEHPEKILELFDWTGVEVEFHEISLDRLKKLLLECLQESFQ